MDSEPSADFNLCNYNKLLRSFPSQKKKKYLAGFQQTGEKEREERRENRENTEKQSEIHRNRDTDTQRQS